MTMLPIRALEMHGHRMWERAGVARVLAFMQRHAMNTLVLHESDLLHQIVYPRAYFDPYALWSDLPSRRGENAIFNRRAYFDSLLRMAGVAGIQLWINIKEIGFSDEVLALRPELFKDGAVCPSEPFWTDYIGHKLDELCSDFPTLGGVIVSFGSQESRASRVQNRCHCALCREEPLERWYSRLIATMHSALAAHGKRLAVRDFAYKPADHLPLVAAMDAAAPEVIFCIKAMPHDFYLTFPDNPAIRRVAREQWVEYDVMGQFFGWGLMPCSCVDDLHRRFDHWRQMGVEGGVFRIEWERINDLDALDTMAEINLIAAAALARGEDADIGTACAEWLRGRGWPDAGAPWLADLLECAAAVVRASAYTLDFVSADNSMLPRSVERAWWGMEGRDSLAVWDSSRGSELHLDAQSIARIVAEKDGALAAARVLLSKIRDPGDAVAPVLSDYVRSAFEFFGPWVEGLGLCTKVCFLARWVAEGSADAGTAARLEVLLNELDHYTERMQELVARADVRHQVTMLIDPARARDILKGGRAALASARAADPRATVGTEAQPG